MGTKTSKPDKNSVKTPQPPQVIDPSKKPVEKNNQRSRAEKPAEKKKLSPNEEL